MNVIKEINRINDKEIKLGVNNIEGSWHYQYKDSNYVFVGGLDYELTEGDVICVFSQYGDVADIHLVRDKQTGKSKGFGFLKYVNWKSTVLSVDNFNGITLVGRTIRVDHCAEYKPPKEDEDEEENEADYLDKSKKKYENKGDEWKHDKYKGNDKRNSRDDYDDRKRNDDKYKSKKSNDDRDERDGTWRRAEDRGSKYKDDEYDSRKRHDRDDRDSRNKKRDEDRGDRLDDRDNRNKRHNEDRDHTDRHKEKKNKTR